MLNRLARLLLIITLVACGKVENNQVKVDKDRLEYLIDSVANVYNQKCLLSYTAETSKEDVPDDTVRFSGQSLMDILTTYCILKLNDEGFISLKEPVNQLVNNRLWENIRVRDLLLHPEYYRDLGIANVLNSIVLEKTGKGVKVLAIFYLTGKELNQNQFFTVSQVSEMLFFIKDYPIAITGADCIVPTSITYQSKSVAALGWKENWWSGVCFRYNSLVAWNTVFLWFAIPEEELVLLTFSHCNDLSKIIPETDNLLSSPYCLAIAEALFSSELAGSISMLKAYSATLLVDTASVFSVQTKNHEINFPIREKPLVSIRAWTNNGIWSDSFTLSEPKSVRLIAVGEGHINNNTGMDVGYTDHLEFYFSSEDNCVREFNTQNNDNLYVFSIRNPDVISGIFRCKSGIDYAFGSKNGSSYVFEAAFPWQTLGLTPCEGEVFSFDMKLVDDDSDGIDKIIGLSDPNQRLDPYPNGLITRDRIGKIQLGNRQASFPAAQFISSPVSINGQTESLWNKAKTYPLDKTILGLPAAKDDLSANIRLLYDKSYLYVLVEVTDAKYSGFHNNSNDYAILYSQTAGVAVWEMDMNNTICAGGEDFNRYCDTIIKLSTGKYKLRYITDNGHSPQGWYGSGPLIPFYGIKVISK